MMNESHDDPADEWITQTDSGVSPGPEVPEGAFETVVTAAARGPALPFAGSAPAPQPVALSPRQRTGTMIDMPEVAPEAMSRQPVAAPPIVAAPAIAALPPIAAPIVAPAVTSWMGSPVPAPPPTVNRPALERAAQEGVAAASLEAARQGAIVQSSRYAPRGVVEPPVEKKHALLVDVLWFEADAVSRLEREPLLSARYDDDLEDDWFEPTDNPSDGDSQARHRVASQLTHAPRRLASEVHRLFVESLEQRAGRRPVVCLEAELRPAFDARALLAHMVEVALLHAEDGPLKATIENCQRALRHPALPDDLAVSLGAKLNHSFQTSEKGYRADHLVSSAERALMLARSYQERRILGRPHVMARLDELVLYLPRQARTQLPLASSFRARVLAEIRARQDYTVPQPLALVAVAVGAIIDARELDTKERR